MMTARPQLILLTAGIVSLSLFFSLSYGSTYIRFDSLFFKHPDEMTAVMIQIRLSRTFSAFVCGGLLALSGSLMQLLLQNSLADPYALGISGGAAFFTLLMMLLGIPSAWLMGSAWFGSIVTMLLLFLLTRKHRYQSHHLLLAGIALACGFSAGISFILLLSPAQHLHSMLFWLMGDLNGASFPWIEMSILVIGLAFCMVLARGFNILSRGVVAAQALGLAAEKYRAAILLLSSLFTAAAVSLAGCIGFIGLIVPHLVRRLTGYDQRLLLPLAVLWGGSLLTAADTIARSWFAPVQLPVGMFTAMIGVPIFIGLLQR